jgi:ankyrin repeat protein
MRAAFSACPESVDFVLSKGANPNIVTPKGETALTISISKNQYEIVQKLIEKGADADQKDSNGLKPIDFAILQGLMDIAKILYGKMKSKELKESFEYEDLGKKYHYRYVNYK